MSTSLALVGGVESNLESLGLEQSQIDLILQGGRMSALGEFIERLLRVGREVIQDGELLVPKGKRVYKRYNKASSREFVPEEAVLFFAEGQKETAHPGVHIAGIVSKTNHDTKLMGVEHLVFYLNNFWRIPDKFKRYSVAFMGTVFANEDRFADNLAPSELFVFIMDWDEEKERPVIRIKPLSHNFDQHYPIAMVA